MLRKAAARQSPLRSSRLQYNSSVLFMLKCHILSGRGQHPVDPKKTDSCKENEVERQVYTLAMRIDMMSCIVFLTAQGVPTAIADRSQMLVNMCQTIFLNWYRRHTT